MRLRAAIVFAIFTMLCSTRVGYAQSSKLELFGKEYVGGSHNSLFLGKLGDSSIGFFIHDLSDSIIDAHYFYRSTLKDIQLEGTIVGRFEIVFTTVNAPPSESGTFYLYCDSNVTTFHGDFISNDKRKYLVAVVSNGGSSPDRYGAETDSCIKKFYYAVLSGDKKTAAEYVAYPVRINITSRRHYFINNKKEFLKKYDQLFGPKMVDAFKRDVPHDLFAKNGGIMLAYGYVWFNDLGKVAAINTVE